MYGQSYLNLGNRPLGDCGVRCGLLSGEGIWAFLVLTDTILQTYKIYRILLDFTFLKVKLEPNNVEFVVVKDENVVVVDNWKCV